MRHATPIPRPPRFAAWLVSLFCSPEQTESVLGDLAEEFLDIVSKSGTAFARRWYWRQSAKTIFCLFGAAFRNAPLSIAGIVLAGFLMHWFSAPLPERVAWTILRAQRPYSNHHYKLYVWLINHGTLTASVVTSLFIGCVVAVLAKGREVVAALLLIVVRSVPFLWLLVSLYEHNADRDAAFAAAFHFFVFPWALEMIGILMAGVLVRTLRTVSSRNATIS